MCPAASASPDYRIFADIPGDAAYADSVIRVTAARIESLIGPISIDSLDIFIVASHERFDSLAGNSIPDWGIGVAIPYRHRIVIKSPLITRGDKSLGELTAHEFSHIALATALDYRQMPRWLDEGMAMYFSAEWGWGDNLAVSWAVIFGGIIPLAEIEHLNRFEGDMVRVAYSQSYLAFKYLLDTYGKSGLNILLQNIRAGRRLDYAFITATGTDYNGFEREFSAYLHGRYNIVTLIFDSNLLWIIMALIVVIGFILARWRRKKRFREFEEREKYHSTDFDYGEVEKPDEDKPWD
jgi:hypothetical protein